MRDDAALGELLVLVLQHYGMAVVPHGRNRPARCPFHDDKVSSASVDTERGLFNCHGCDIGGDPFALIMKVEGVSFAVAQQRAQEVAGEVGQRVRGGPGGRRRHSDLPGRAGDQRGQRHRGGTGPGTEWRDRL